jgi:hypothetical protein
MLPPAPPPKSRKGWVIGLSIAVVVLVLCCGCLGLGGFAVYRAIGSEKDRARDNTAEYLDALKDQQYEDAYTMICKRDRDHQTKEQFVTEQTAKPKLVDYDIRGTSISREDGVEYQVRTHLKFQGGSSQNKQFDVVSDDDHLRPCP